ncbi:MAG: hypothetical protein GWN31_16185 [Candidatus Thorarchaeota archaeon]|nr:hypothetical protein [Candidatus Thorarchaeota archaeon]
MPKALKNIEPSYEIFRESQLPTETNELLQKTVVGPNSPVKLKTNVTYDFIRVDNAAFWWTVPETWNGFLYLLDGNCQVADSEVTAGEFLVKEFRDALRTKVIAEPHASFIVVSGQPHGEPIIQRGPFVE